MTDERRQERDATRDERERGAAKRPEENEPGRTPDSAEGERKDADPPRTTTGPLTAPKFGSAGSGGAEYEPGPEGRK